MAYDHPDTFTHSKLLSFSCPLRYKNLHVLGLRDDSDPARRGSTIHAASELYINALVEAELSSDFDLAQGAFQAALVQESTPAHLVPDCEDLWLSHVERFELDLAAFLEAEQRQTVTEFSFKPDLVYVRPDMLEILDIKTHYVGLTEAGAKDDFQARTYAYLARETWPGFPIYRFSFLFIRLRHQVSVDFEPAELDKVGRQLTAHADAIRAAYAADEWPAAPGYQCRFCTFACSAVDDAAREPVRLLTMDDAIKTAADLAVLKQAVSLKTSVLSAYTGDHGPVEQGGVEWGHRQVESVKFPVEGVVDALRSVQADASKLSIGKSSLRTFLTSKKWQHVAPLLNDIAVTTPGTRFGARKLGAVGDEPSEEQQ